MTGAWVTLRRELLSYAVSPVGWLIGFLFYLWRGLELTGVIAQFALLRLDKDALPGSCYGFWSTLAMAVLVPGVLTMKSFSEERRTGSIETLMTAPVRDGGVVFGKWAAAVVFYAVLWFPSVVVLWVLQAQPFLRTEVQFGPILSAYLGMFLLSCMLIAFGCLASSLTDNVLLAALLGILFPLVLLASPWMLQMVLSSWSGNYYVEELIRKFSVLENFRDWFARGLIDTSQVAFYAGGTLFFLFLTTASLSARRVA